MNVTYFATHTTAIDKWWTNRCYYSSMEQYYGEQCELFRRGAGFFTVLFSALGVVLLIFCVLVVAIVVLRRKRKLRKTLWKSNNPYIRRDALDADYFNFLNTGSSTGWVPGRSGLYELDDSINLANEFSPVFSPSLECVDSSLNVKIKRPELLSSFPDG